MMIKRASQAFLAPIFCAPQMFSLKNGSTCIGSLSLPLLEEWGSPKQHAGPGPEKKGMLQVDPIAWHAGRIARASHRTQMGYKTFVCATGLHGAGLSGFDLEASDHARAMAI